MQVIAYSYEAAHHCPQCAGNRFGTSWETGFVLESARDREGNEIGAVAPCDEWFEPSEVSLQVLACDTCGKHLDEYLPADEIIAAAAEEGSDAGRADGTWAVDGNSSAEECRRLLDAIRDGDPVFEVPAPLSGEWADSLLPVDVLRGYGLDEEHPLASDVLDAFEEGYAAAYVAEVERACLVQVEPEGSR